MVTNLIHGRVMPSEFPCIVSYFKHLLFSGAAAPATGGATVCGGNTDGSCKDEEKEIEEGEEEISSMDNYLE